MINVLGNDLCIELACLHDCNNPPFKYYFNELLINHPENLVIYSGINLITKFCPQLLWGITVDLNHRNIISLINPNYIDMLNNTPILYAAAQGDLNTVALLRSLGADPNYINTNLCNAIRMAILFNRTNMIKYLLDSGITDIMVDLLLGFAQLNNCDKEIIATLSQYKEKINAFENYFTTLNARFFTHSNANTDVTSDSTNPKVESIENSPSGDESSPFENAYNPFENEFNFFEDESHPFENTQPRKKKKIK
jgi:ankyrin repeat protein